MSSFRLDVEQPLDQLHRTIFEPLAAQYRFDLPKNPLGDLEKPTVLIVGNHSSGKSTFVNYLLGNAIQRTGLAPVDDGFTILTHGETASELDGPALVSNAAYPYGYLERFGKKLVSRLRLKALPLALLRDITLIDSPGMIDSAASGMKNDRGYDFFAVLKKLGEMADIVVLFFDPDKPGTTGETLEALQRSFQEIDHKLYLVMSKVDRFDDNMRDFARAYGALCWNLARTMQNKDLPHIFNIYVPLEERKVEAGSSLPFFDESREELLREIRKAPARHSQNRLSQFYDTAQLLDVHARVCGELAQRLVGRYLAYGAVTVLLLVGAFLLGEQLLRLPSVYSLGLAGGLALLVLFAGYLDVKYRRQMLPFTADGAFERVYQDQLSSRHEGESHEFSQQLWRKVRERTVRVVTSGGFGLYVQLLPWRVRRRLRALQQAIVKDIPALRQQLSAS